MPDIEIYGPTVSPFVVKVIAAAAYKQLEYTHHAYMTVREVYKVSPITGRIPVVSFDGEMVYDSTFITRRFDEIQPEKPLLSSDPKLRAKQRMLEDWSDESLYWYMMGLRWVKENAHRSVKQNSKYLPSVLRPVAGPLFRNFIGSRTRAQGFGRLPYRVLIGELGERLDDLVVILDDQTYFFGETPCVADFAIYGQMSTGMEDGVTPDFAEQVQQRSSLMDWQKRVSGAINAVVA